MGESSQFMGAGAAILAAFLALAGAAWSLALPDLLFFFFFTFGLGFCLSIYIYFFLGRYMQIRKKRKKSQTKKDREEDLKESK